MALPEFPDNPCECVSGSQTPAVFGRIASACATSPWPSPASRGSAFVPRGRDYFRNYTDIGAP